MLLAKPTLLSFIDLSNEIALCSLLLKIHALWKALKENMSALGRLTGSATLIYASKYHLSVQPAVNCQPLNKARGDDFQEEELVSGWHFYNDMQSEGCNEYRSGHLVQSVYGIICINKSLTHRV